MSMRIIFVYQSGRYCRKKSGPAAVFVVDPSPISFWATAGAGIIWLVLNCRLVVFFSSLPSSIEYYTSLSLSKIEDVTGEEREEYDGMEKLRKGMVLSEDDKCS